MQKTLVPLFWLNLVGVVGLFAFTGGFQMHSTASAWEMIGGRLTALLATNLFLLQMLLAGRNPVLDRLAGMDKLFRWHARLGKTSFLLLLGHVFLIILAYTGGIFHSMWHETASLVMHTRDMLLAVIAFGMFCAVVVTSLKKARKRMRYQTWHFVHLYAYLGVALALPHQIFVGADFAHHTSTKIYWSVLYVLCVGSLTVFRFILPLRNTLRHRLEVTQVIEETGDTTSVYIAGKHLHRFRAHSGQFFIWRFLDRQRIWEAHPFSLSAPPNSEHLRITVKALGDHSASMSDLKVGTRVIAEGPYGAFTAKARTRRKVVLIGGGVGITPIRALAETFPVREGEMTVIYRMNDARTAALYAELDQVCRERCMPLIPVEGTLESFKGKPSPFSPRHLLYVAPAIAESDVYVCGPPPMTEAVVESLRTLGVPTHQIHFESFAF